MILAAGAGTRLRPLTLSRPKPLVPIANTPNIEHILKLLKNAGIREIAINLHLHSEQIKRFVGTGKKWALDVRYSWEPELMGTAGSLAPLKNFFKKETFFVLSGDGLMDISLEEVLAFHRKKKSLATMVLSKTDARCEYGLVRLDSDQRIDAIREKPTWGDFYSPHINTGIYVLEPEILKLIPDKGEYDFAKNLWPRLINEGQNVHGYVLNSYWCDIGNLKEYRRCHRDILEGRTNMAITGEEIKPGVWIGKNTKIAKTAKFESPIVIGSGVVIEKNAKINAFSVIGDDCQIGEKAQITESILWDKVVVAANVKVDGCVLADKTVLRENVAFYEGAVINISAE